MYKSAFFININQQCSINGIGIDIHIFSERNIYTLVII
jgi:hypothetical protein